MVDWKLSMASIRAKAVRMEARIISNTFAPTATRPRAVTISLIPKAPALPAPSRPLSLRSTLETPRATFPSSSSTSMITLPSAIVSPPFPAYLFLSLEVLLGSFLERLIGAHPLDLFTDPQNQLGEVARDDHDRRGALINLLECPLPQQGIEALAEYLPHLFDVHFVLFRCWNFLQFFFEPQGLLAEVQYRLIGYLEGEFKLPNLDGNFRFLLFDANCHSLCLPLPMISSSWRVHRISGRSLRPSRPGLG